MHYTEYLCGLVFRNNIDPISLLDLGELKQVFARANHFMPKQRPGEYEFQYKKRLAEVTFTKPSFFETNMPFSRIISFQLIANEIPLEKAWKNVRHPYVANMTVIELGTIPLLHITQKTLKLFAYTKFTENIQSDSYRNCVSSLENSLFGRFIAVF